MDARSSRKALNARRALVAAALCAVLALVYWRAPRMQFLHLDDYTAIVDNPRLNPPSLAGIPFFWRSAHMNLYVPMPYTAWELVALSAGHPVQGSARWEFPPGAFHLDHRFFIGLGAAMLIATFDPEFQQRLKNRVLLAGGGSQIKGLDLAIEAEMKRTLGSGKVLRIEEPMYGGANGALKIAHDMPAEYWEKLK